MCPFSIYPLYTRTVILSLDKPIADCFLFRPRKSREKRRKRSHINASNASVIWASRVSQTPLQAPFPTSINGYHAAKKFLSQWPAKRSTFAFAGESGLHTRLCSKDRTHGLTRRNRGLPDRAAITTLGAFRTFTNIPGPGVRTAYFAAFGSWSGVLPKNAESLGTAMRMMRVAAPKASRPRRAA